MTTRRSQLQEDTYFRVLRMLQDNPDLTQREIAQQLGVSTSGLNYCLNALIEKGWLKVQNFSQSKKIWLHLRSDPARHFGKKSRPPAAFCSANTPNTTPCAQKSTA